MVHYIPIGTDCWLAHRLRMKGMRHFALPYDWVVHPIDSVIESIASDFSEFMHNRHLRFLPIAYNSLYEDTTQKLVIQDDVQITPVYCTKYNMLFIHDFGPSGIQELQQVQQKYKKRIRRFTSILNDTNDEVIFISGNLKPGVYVRQYLKSIGIEFTNDYTDWKSRMSNVLDSKYPKLRYRLLDKAECSFLPKITR